MMVDFHTHILYEVDDGAADIETSMELIDMLESQGVHDIVLTPHYYFDTTQLTAFLKSRDEKVEQIRKRIGDRDIRVHAASEVRLTTRTNVEQLEKLAVEGGRYVVVELPFTKEIMPGLLQKIDQLIDYTAMTPIIAHAELYPYCQSSPQLMQYLVMQGCLLQLNLSSLLVRRFRRLALKMLEKNLVHVLGTDCHNPVTRAPRYRSAAKKIINHVGREYFDKLQQNMKSILRNEIITPPTPVAIKKTLFGYK